MLLMDIKVYKKEEVALPKGNSYVYVPNCIDLIPTIENINGTDVVTGATFLEEDSKDLIEQECSLATIWQRGLDPLDENSGIHWSETLLGEVNVVQLMLEIEAEVAKVTTSVSVHFDVITDNNGVSYLTYTLQEVV